MTAQTLNAIGLILNIAGVVLVFFFGLPQPSHEKGVSLGHEDGTVFADGTSVAEINAKAKRRKNIYTALAYIALSLLLAEFVCQLIATCWL
ncbi:hypothetical protein SAMN06296273_2599 [Nitrosomonas ureae]|uniref:Uncharacterized protein n=1 Tax=Nitrosomonas ureae TaxID=44577 RepID=A0A285C1F1_9PROT|nr:hypothetical protein [Nitrosomonas ureae]SNX61145.1 hypothetical protein SAMN06296273_2599 [Nitrosomonas ureae]